MRRPVLRATTYRRITLLATILLATIIVSGAAVRLTGSGLGCRDWPNCEPGQLTPHLQSGEHQLIEGLNRLFTGLVSLSVIVCVLGSMFRVPRRRDLAVLSWGLVAGVFAQAVLGGLTVIFELRPEIVMSHFLLSMVLLTNAVVLHRRAGQPDGAPRLVTAPVLRSASRVLLGLAALVVVTGTIVTSTGPHGGDEDAKRFALYLPDVAKLHGASVVAFLSAILVTLWLVRRTRAPERVQRRLGVLLAVVVAQAAIGYIQYFNDIPALLVGFHIVGVTLVWTAVVSFSLGLSERGAPPDTSAPAAPRDAGALAGT